MQSIRRIMQYDDGIIQLIFMHHMHKAGAHSISKLSLKYWFTLHKQLITQNSLRKSNIAQISIWDFDRFKAGVTVLDQ